MDEDIGSLISFSFTTSNKNKGTPCYFLTICKISYGSLQIDYSLQEIWCTPVFLKKKNADINYIFLPLDCTSTETNIFGKSFFHFQASATTLYSFPKGNSDITICQQIWAMCVLTPYNNRGEEQKVFNMRAANVCSLVRTRLITSHEQDAAQILLPTSFIIAMQLHL